MPDDARSAIVLFSGGQDSTTCLFWALSPAYGAFDRVEAVSFEYGQRHAVELEQARQIADAAGVPHTVLDARGLLGGSALMADEGGDTGAEHPLMPKLPASFVPGRNALMLTAAASYGFRKGIKHLVAGMCENDYSGYPDCRPDFAESQEKTLSLAFGSPIHVWTPLMHLVKAETWKLAADLGTVRGLNVLQVVREMSHTDYHGDRSEKHDWGYGKLNNSASVLRAQGYAEAVANGWIPDAEKAAG
ncbi:7-cyano-7-deazaguanine synthase QueC [Rubrivirga sp.]|uniref:7-cyano-7-deazaguanine synthase QueC n=1 Tax=Rubrivirga sp. TaxID=1885344 RepID=UPI003C794192